MTDHVPKGSFTKHEYMNKYGCKETRARNEIRQLIADGKLLKTVVQVVYYTPTGKMDSCPTAQKSKRTKKT